ncbi:hypothetical protein B7494_g1611 [Chlorociboria aeruginascens]|nr:hypothetical protein B7494_g1611 [Chlorociboria aeruginascens]
MSSNPSYGTKVNDPHSTIREGAGAVALDSLAADSTREGGGFSENRNSEPLGVSGSNSTFANTDTSSARRLDPASDAEARMAEDDWAEEKKLGASDSRYGGSKSDVDTAPSYVASLYVDKGDPKGRNLTEGTERYDGKNASFNGDIGGINDPGRVAEQAMLRSNANTEASSGLPAQKGMSGNGQFDVLGGDTSA